MNKLLSLVTCAVLLSSCAPTMNALSRANATSGSSLSAPLLAGQTWEVEGGTVATGSRLTIKTVELFETTPGVYSNLDRTGLIAAQSGKPAEGASLFPAVSYTRLGQRLDFYWSERGTDYNCRAENVAPDATRVTGRFFVSGSELGTCTAQLR